MVVLKEIWPTKDTPIWSILPTGQAKYTKKQDKIKKIIRSNKNLREFSAFRGEKFFITKWPTKDTPIRSFLPTGQAKNTKRTIRELEKFREFSAFRGEKFFITKWPTKDMDLLNIAHEGHEVH